MRRFRAGYLAAASLTVAAAATGRDRWQWVSKPLLMPLLAADIATAGSLRPGDRTLLLGGLGAATVGDALLIEPDDDRRLVAGAAAFAVLQSGYATLWWRYGARPRVATVVPRAAAWAGAAALLHARAPRLAVALSAYGATLGTAAVLAADPELAPGAKKVAGLAVPGVDPRSRLGVGALLFTISDGLIVLRRVLARGRLARRTLEAAILASYSAAQYLLADPDAHNRG